ncbi:hypothetical protein [Chthoniobacter flavus]|uniref:hypothetical protein n=1 Tax=Chthoniobacter flavus TaxID=191863 RepID=UPI0010475AB7|nr:hypothetical protein [Chthoniobacter flavus]
MNRFGVKEFGELLFGTNFFLITSPEVILPELTGREVGSGGRDGGRTFEKVRLNENSVSRGVGCPGVPAQAFGLNKYSVFRK